MRIIKYINDNWLYSNTFKKEYLMEDRYSEFKNIDIPHTNTELPYNYFDERMYQFVSSYVKKINISNSHRGKRIFIDFEGVMIYCDIYLNGKYISNHKGGYTPFSVEITDYVDFENENTLLVVVDSTEREDIPPYGNVVDYLTFGGIYREVSLRILNETYINKVYGRCSNCLEEDKNLEVEIEINSVNDNNEIEIIVELVNGNDILYEEKEKFNVNEGLNNKIVNLKNIKNIKLWDLENPKLYTIRVILKQKNETLDIYEDRFGFREAKFKSEGFYLNGRLTKLIGLNRHQSYPYMGYAMPERIQKKDADILRYDLGVNIVRTSHYPQSRHFLDRCDEIGLLVLEEIPGWQHIGDSDWQSLVLRDVEDMIIRDYNRPSIILWGVRINESRDNHNLYTKTNDLARKLDPIRQTAGVRCIKKSEFLEDVFTLNDFSHNGGELVFVSREEGTGLKEKVPYLITENNGHMYPTKAFDCEARRIEHTKRHIRVINEAMGSSEISGSIAWCAFDYNTHSSFGSGDKICYHGVMDMFRNNKYAAYSYASQKDPKYGIVLEAITLASRGERDGGGVIPFTILTNCNYIKLFKNGEYIDNYYPNKDLYPHLLHPPINICHILSRSLDLPVLDEDKEIIRSFIAERANNGDYSYLDIDNIENCGVIKEIAKKSNISTLTLMLLVNELIVGWGKEANVFTIKGYINDEEVITKEIGELKWMDHLEVIPDDYELSLDKTSYDATRIVVKILDNLGNQLHFNNDFVEVEIDGPARVMGPNKFSILGGITAFWIRTIGKAGDVKLKVSSTYYSSEVIIKIR